MSAADQEWEVLRDMFAQFARHIGQAKSVNINTAALRKEAQAVSERYFRQVRSHLGSAADELRTTLDVAFQSILELSQRASAAALYRKQIRTIQRVVPKISSHLVVNHGSSLPAESDNAEDVRIIQTLAGLVPSAARSYRQALIDLADQNRISFRGPALELREALRETLDHLAPDEDVMSVKGFTLEKDRTKPTMKQKVRFILKARGQSKSSSEVPEHTANTIEETIGALTRSIYDKSSVATHVAAERRTVQQLKRYIGTILHEILSL